MCKKINVIVFCNKCQVLDYLKHFVEERKCFFEILIWVKTNPVPLANGAYLRDKEYILAFWESGTTAVACKDNGRHFIGFEQNPK